MKRLLSFVTALILIAYCATYLASPSDDLPQASDVKHYVLDKKNEADSIICNVIDFFDNIPIPTL
ncbi:MAG: hypothetical protein J6M07_10700 [Ruminococcus sp.]|jgi:hypothetical protein|nr:hypothetical protein [Ruminococcus sp.]